MKYIREKLRNLKYKIKFLGKKKNMSFSYLSNSKNNKQLTDLMNLSGSDKGGRNNHHNFASYHSEIFFHKRNDIKNFLEIGLGTNDTSVLSNMGLNGIPLASLRAWRGYFKNANIWSRYW